MTPEKSILGGRGLPYTESTALFMPVVILGGIYGGIFTPTKLLLLPASRSRGQQLIHRN
jgi:hypothetical protein